MRVVVLLAVVAWGTTAAAADMSCRTVSAIFDAKKPDLAQVEAAGEIVIAIYNSLDDRNAKIGRRRMFEQMSADGQNTTVAMATARCSQHPRDTLQRSAVEVYRGLEEMGEALGVSR